MAVGRVLVVENDAGDPIAALGGWLQAAGVELIEVKAHAGQSLPSDLAGYDGLVVMGGEMGAAADEVAPWLPQVRALLQVAVAAELPTLGVCLGGQLLALAAGGTVGRNPEGPEIGAGLVAKRQAAAGDPLFRALPITPDVMQWHSDAVTTLPRGAELLASSPGCAVQAFRVGRLAWGLQFHIENTAEMVREWAANTPATDLDLDLVVRRSVAALPDIAETWAPFATTFAGLVLDPGSVRIARTVPSSTAEPITDKAAIRAALAAEAEAARAPTGSSDFFAPMAPPGRSLPLAGPPDRP